MAIVSIASNNIDVLHRPERPRFVPGPWSFSEAVPPVYLKISVTE